MTYLELVNGVLRRLREDQVSAVDQNPYSLLIGDLVNDAKRIVEDAWDWSALRTTLTISTTADIFNYVLVGSGNRIKIIDVINDTSNWFMTYKDTHWMDNAFLNETRWKHSPSCFHSFITPLFAICLPFVLDSPSTASGIFSGTGRLSSSMKKP